MRGKIIQPKAGDIIYFYHAIAQQRKYAVVIEPLQFHIDKTTVNAVILTTKRLDRNYPFNHHLSIKERVAGRPSKAICDQPIPIVKESILKIVGKVSEETLQEIRKKVIKNINPELI